MPQVKIIEKDGTLRSIFEKNGFNVPSFTRARRHEPVQVVVDGKVYAWPRERAALETLFPFLEKAPRTPPYEFS